MRLAGMSSCAWFVDSHIDDLVLRPCSHAVRKDELMPGDLVMQHRPLETLCQLFVVFSIQFLSLKYLLFAAS